MEHPRNCRCWSCSNSVDNELDWNMVNDKPKGFKKWLWNVKLLNYEYEISFDRRKTNDNKCFIMEYIKDGKGYHSDQKINIAYGHETGHLIRTFSLGYSRHDKGTSLSYGVSKEDKYHYIPPNY